MVITALVFILLLNYQENPSLVWGFTILNYMYLCGLIFGIPWTIAHVNFADNANYQLEQDNVKRHLNTIIFGYFGINLWYFWITVGILILYGIAGVVYLLVFLINRGIVIPIKSILPSMDELIEFIKFK